MNATDIERLLYVLGSQQIKYSGGWVNGSCPFAPWRHQKGKDTHPSFGVSIWDGGTSHAYCHACGVKGDLKSILWRLVARRPKGPWWEKACQLVLTETASMEEIDDRIQRAENPQGTISQRLSKASYDRTPSARQRELPSIPHEGATVLRLDHLEYTTYPDSDLDQYRTIPQEVTDYLTGKKRRLTKTTIQLWELGWNEAQRRIVIPVRDWDGKLVCFSGRSIEKFDPTVDKWISEVDPKFKHSYGFKRNFFLFGEHLATQGEPGVLVEGHFDAMYLRQMGYTNAVAVMGSALSDVQVEKLVTMFSEVTIVPDGDEPGGHAAESWAYKLKGRVPVRIVPVVQGRDPDEYDEAELAKMFGSSSSDV